ncbi:MAG: M3 family metallopeptidase [Kouleothrix sp.]
MRRDAFKHYYSGYQGILNTLGTRWRPRCAAMWSMRGCAATQTSLWPPHSSRATSRSMCMGINLVKTINANLPRLHRYMGAAPADLRGSTICGSTIRTRHRCRRLPMWLCHMPRPAGWCRRLSKPLGADYAEALSQAFSKRWIDVYENVGKRSGAYSSGSYSTPPFILLNYQDRPRDMFTLAHELGHSMHSYFTRRTQPFAYDSDSDLVAEVASTLNEALLTDYLLKTRDDPSAACKCADRAAARRHPRDDLPPDDARRPELDIHQRDRGRREAYASTRSTRAATSGAALPGPAGDARRRDRFSSGPSRTSNAIQLLCLPGGGHRSVALWRLAARSSAVARRSIACASAEVAARGRRSIVLRDAGVDMTTPR